MLILVTRRFLRLFFVLLLLFFLLPLVSFYINGALRPEPAGFYPPQAQAVAARPGGAEAGKACSLRTRIVFYIHDFYQNGL
ncbi:MAG TPA: hypothetical protein GX699_06005 [Firmicutes bacterium]|nr:hypothetical protein [Bacillota bacterium]